MASSLQGAPQLRARLKAIRQVGKPILRAWGDETVILARPHIPVRTGKTRASVRVTHSTLRKTTVGGDYPINFINAGTVAHDVVAKNAKTLRFTVGGKPMFAKRVHIPAKGARPFKRSVGLDAIYRMKMVDRLITLWNSASPVAARLR